MLDAELSIKYLNELKEKYIDGEGFDRHPLPEYYAIEDGIEALHKAIEKEPKTDVLDKIRAEIEQNAYPIVHGVNNHEKGMTLYGILQVIDKYRESEDKK